MTIFRGCFQKIEDKEHWKSEWGIQDFFVTTTMLFFSWVFVNELSFRRYQNQYVHGRKNPLQSPIAEIKCTVEICLSLCWLGHSITSLSFQYFIIIIYFHRLMLKDLRQNALEVRVEHPNLQKLVTVRFFSVFDWLYNVSRRIVHITAAPVSHFLSWVTRRMKQNTYRGRP